MHSRTHSSPHPLAHEGDEGWVINLDHGFSARRPRIDLYSKHILALLGCQNLPQEYESSTIADIKSGKALPKVPQQIFKDIVAQAQKFVYTDFSS